MSPAISINQKTAGDEIPAHSGNHYRECISSDFKFQVRTKVKYIQFDLPKAGFSINCRNICQSSYRI
ncbi:MAG TPA: hypothetical protein DC049_17400 [Spirochaetia bacterium]|nr:hypothetical protein [Spirochaetia bacterium]